MALVVIGTRQHGLLMLAHEGTHHLACQDRRWNDLLTRLFCSWPLGVSLEGYRRFHLPHHRQLGTEKDPEIRLRAGRLFDGRGRSWELVLHTAGALLGLGLPRLLRLLLATRAPRVGEAVGLALFHATALALLFWSSALWMAAVWWVALVTTAWAAFSLREWTEHVGTPGTHRIGLPGVLRILTHPHGAWMHYEHHASPWVPQWRLEEARALDQEEPVVNLTMLAGHHLRGAAQGYRPGPIFKG